MRRKNGYRPDFKNRGDRDIGGNIEPGIDTLGKGGYRDACKHCGLGYRAFDGGGFAGGIV